MLDTLVYVTINMMMLDKFTSIMIHDLKPIDLDNLGQLPNYEEIHIDENFDSIPSTKAYIDDLMNYDNLSRNWMVFLFKFLLFVYTYFMLWTTIWILIVLCLKR